MKLCLFLISCLLSASAVVLSSHKARADSLVQTSMQSPPVERLSSSHAQGLTGILPTLTVWSGAGTNLNFIPTGEIVKKVWLDDPSQITLDFDGPMCIMGSNGTQNNCSSSAATVIHLRRIHQLKFPNLPRTATTLLSVVTTTPPGERKLYQFRVAYGTGNPQYHTIAIYPDPSVADARRTPSVIQLSGLRQAGLDDIERGLQVAKARNLLGRSQGNPRLEIKVQNFLALVRNGLSIQSALKQAGVSMALISKLGEFGLKEKHIGSTTLLERFLSVPRAPTLVQPVPQPSVGQSSSVQPTIVQPALTR